MKSYIRTNRTHIHAIIITQVKTTHVETYQYIYVRCNISVKCIYIVQIYVAGGVITQDIGNAISVKHGDVVIRIYVNLSSVRGRFEQGKKECKRHRARLR